jgi:sugar lactone lactonase YvrE
MGVVLDQAGQMIVANEASLLRIDPQTGAQTVIRDTTGAPGLFWNLALDRNGEILVAAETAILRVNPTTGDMQTVSSSNLLNMSLSVATGGSRGSEIYATSVRNEAGIGWVGSIVLVDAKTGRQTLLADGGNLGFLLGIAVQNGDIFVTTVKGHDSNFGVGQVIHVDARTGKQTVVAEGGYLMRPAGISVDSNGQLVVADPYTMNPDSETLFDGAVIRIDPATGNQALVSRGQGSSLNPCAVTVVH